MRHRAGRRTMGHHADLRRLARAELVDALRVLARLGCAEKALPDFARRGAVFPRYAGRRPEARLLGDVPDRFAGKRSRARRLRRRRHRDGQPDSARFVFRRRAGLATFAGRRRISRASTRGARGWRPTKSGKPACCRNGSKTRIWTRPTCIIATFRISRACSRAGKLRRVGRPNCSPPRVNRWNGAATRRPAGASAGKSIYGRAYWTAITLTN